LMSPVEVNEETLALDLIDQIGPDGQFLDSEHTMAHFRERWYPDVFERGNYDHWVAAGGKNLGERAAERVERILAPAGHRPQPLPEDVAQQVQVIVRRAEEKIGVK
jgi:trimethylamine--corrinoid protein Co-methyltransferase